MYNIYIHIYIHIYIYIYVYVYVYIQRIHIYELLHDHMITLYNHMLQSHYITIRAQVDEVLDEVRGTAESLETHLDAASKL